MDTRSIDYAYALSLTKRLNSLVEKEPRLRGIFLWGGFNLWQGYQSALFSDAKIWSKEKRLSQASISLEAAAKLVLAGMALAVITLASALYLFISKKTILVFTEDKIEGKFKNDFRLEPLYEALTDEKVSYMEVIHTLTNKETFKKFLRRGREAVYIESIDFLLWPLVILKKREARKLLSEVDLDGFSPEEKEFALFELEKYISSREVTIGRFRFFRWMMGLSKIEKVFAIDDTRHYSEFVAAGQSRCIPTFAIEHGHFTKYHTGWLKMTKLPGEVMRPPKLIVWSEYWKKELLRLGTYWKPSEIFVGGRRESFEWAPYDRSEKRLGVLVPYETDAPKAEVREYIEELLREKSIEVIFKLRADLEKNDQLEEYGLLDKADKITVVHSLEDVLPRIGLAVGTYSTMLYDMVERMRPVAILKTSLDYGEGMVENGLAELISGSKEAAKRVKSIAKTPQKTLEARRESLVGGERRRLVSVLRDLIKENVPA